MDGLTLSKFREVRQILNSPLDSVEQIVNVVSAVSGITKSQIKSVNYQKVLDMFNHILKVIASYKASKPKKEITIKGVTYEFKGKTENWNAAQWIDANMYRDTWKTDLHKTAAIIYVEKGTVYGEEKNKKTIHPMAQRAEIFNKHFPSSLYLDIEGFFLQKLNKQQRGFSKEKRVDVLSLVGNMQKILKSQILTG